MKFKPLPPGLAARLIQGVPNILTPLSDDRMSAIKKMACPRCHAAMAPQLYTPQIFSDHDPLPRTMAYCQECGATVDPLTNIVLHTGDPRKVEESLPIIRTKLDD